MTERRNWMCTINIDEENVKDPLTMLPDFTVFTGIKRFAFQLERGEINKGLHWQIFLEFKYARNKEDVYKESDKQGICMHVDNKYKNASKHPKAGRKYVKKGNMIDDHRYKWIDGSWKNGKMPPKVEKEEKLKLPPWRRIDIDKLFSSNIPQERWIEMFGKENLIKALNYSALKAKIRLFPNYILSKEERELTFDEFVYNEKKVSPRTTVKIV